jgi:hypothetical protein
MRVLDQALPDELEAAWRAHGAEIATVLAPGLSDDPITALVEPLGPTLPAEARSWWGRHDGVTATTVFGWEIGPEVGFSSLAKLLAAAGRLRPRGLGHRVQRGPHRRVGHVLRLRGRSRARRRLVGRPCTCSDARTFLVSSWW